MHSARSSNRWQWASEEFGGGALGDARRTQRLISVAARAAERPSGRLSEVFTDPAELQAAYDFIESTRVDATAIGAAMGRATVRKLAGAKHAFVAVDGTSLTLIDRRRSKDFGAIGSYKHGHRGLKLLHSYAVSDRGVPIGPCVQHWWARPAQKPKRKGCRPLRTKESRHWSEVVERTAALFASEGDVRPWFQLDREGDAGPTLRTLLDGGHLFTVRGAWNRRLRTRKGEPKLYVRDVVTVAPQMLVMELAVPEGPRRQARRAKLVVRAARVEISINNQWSKWHYNRVVHSIQVLEVDTTPKGEKPIEWMLWTNAPIDTAADVQRVVFGYTQRWRIEELHRAWKTVCRVEETQLHKQAHVIKWATILLAVAARAEHLKRQMREHPEVSAADEFTRAEIKALLFLKRRQKKRTELVPDAVPTIAQAVRWIADIGGYTGKSSGGPPGAVTIARGLERLEVAASVFAALEE